MNLVESMESRGRILIVATDAQERTILTDVAQDREVSALNAPAVARRLAPRA